jgi:predicted transcriptional regulator YdeE
MSPEELGGTRAFRTDYEIYDQRSTDPENAQVDVYVGLR